MSSLSCPVRIHSRYGQINNVHVFKSLLRKVLSFAVKRPSYKKVFVQLFIKGYLSNVCYVLISGGEKGLRHSACPQGAPCLGGHVARTDLCQCKSQ